MMLYNSVFGYTELEILSASASQTIEKLNQEGITLYDLRMPDDLTLSLKISRKDFKKLQAIAKNHGDIIKNSQHKGLVFKRTEFSQYCTQ